jgi:H2-forming N5,N10-methylenetetrahydromethanopterin dehydrogenase-like enzyme
MDNLLSGAIGAILGTILGTIVTSIVSYHIFHRQARIESNRIFLQDIVKVLQRIYVLELTGRKISDEDINFLVSFKIVAFEDFDIISNELDAINKMILQYNEGVQKTIEKTATSHLELSAKEDLTKQIRNLILKIRKLT